MAAESKESDFKFALSPEGETSGMIYDSMGKEIGEFKSSEAKETTWHTFDWSSDLTLIIPTVHQFDSFTNLIFQQSSRTVKMYLAELSRSKLQTRSIYLLKKIPLTDRELMNLMVSEPHYLPNGKMLIFSSIILTAEADTGFSVKEIDGYQLGPLRSPTPVAKDSSNIQNKLGGIFMHIVDLKTRKAITHAIPGGEQHSNFITAPKLFILETKVK
ncbi:MAG: hypothetical protein Harvfovirus3_42 [Harvfovirus sp.]|uniref:Uncharacterized protein n=1 Tax=Harvfovirus sp. TaxID=2487768 RepID=A0A3G5A087_9VIRU|nr:MAG: hypothetical protein Harvfovirus3_42 [Harvfovirus sp.]